MLQKYDLLAVPVVDNENRITGIVTIDDAIDIIQEESQEDISKMAGIAPTTKPYLQTSVFSIFKNRLPWLLILLVSATFTGIIINEYEGTLNMLSPLLFACVPMLMGTGGNSGSQASVTVIQSLATGEVELKDVFKVIWKEIRVSIMVALILAIACFGKLMLIDNMIYNHGRRLRLILFFLFLVLLAFLFMQIITNVKFTSKDWFYIVFHTLFIKFKSSKHIPMICNCNSIPTTLFCYIN